MCVSCVCGPVCVCLYVCVPYSALLYWQLRLLSVQRAFVADGTLCHMTPLKLRIRITYTLRVGPRHLSSLQLMLNLISKLDTLIVAGD